MANITYKRSFQHDDWIDNEDIVQAGGEQGFNAKFHGLEAEFDQLSTVIAQINASLVPVVPAVTLSFAPAFFPNTGQTPWTQINGIASKATGQTGADGWLPLQLPDGRHIQNITVIGDKSGNLGSFQVQLIRQQFTGGSTTLLAISLGSEPDGTFQITASVPAANNLIDNGTNKYFIIAKIIGADAAASARIFVIQSVCGSS